MISLHMNMRFPYLNTTKQHWKYILGGKITKLLKPKPQFYMKARSATSILLAV